MQRFVYLQPCVAARAPTPGVLVAIYAGCAVYAADRSRSASSVVMYLVAPNESTLSPRVLPWSTNTNPSCARARGSRRQHPPSVHRCRQQHIKPFTANENAGNRMHETT
eukprot:1741134-Rhodomonas_salina.9